MTGHTHSLAEWAQMGLLAVAVFESFSVAWFVFVDAHRSDFPRLWQAAVDARHDVDWAAASAVHLAGWFLLDVRLTVRSAALAAAALLALLLPAPEGATR